jgi:MFS family permease
MNRKWISYLLIIISGEAIFMLPFLIPRLYRPLMIEGWKLSNTDIGAAFSAYGITAMISYFVGGPFADKFHPRWLISLSMLLTAIGGVPLIFWPSGVTFTLVYCFFGMSTILLMWGSLIKVTHLAGGELNRSSAMGILDSGRGLTAALISSLLVLIISSLYSEIDLKTDEHQALQVIYATVIIFNLLIALGIWWSLKDFDANSSRTNDWSMDKTLLVLKNPNVWLLSIIILSSYCGYKSIDNYSIYLVDVQNRTLIESSRFTSIIFWLRPISAILVGIATDKFHHRYQGGRFIVLSLLLLLGSISQFLLAFDLFSQFNLIFYTVLLSASFAYALRAIYFSVFGDLRTSNYLVGTTVGIVSFVGFLPDVFFGLITGHLIDSNPGATGFSYAFTFTALFLLVGSIASALLFLRATELAENKS